MTTVKPYSITLTTAISGATDINALAVFTEKGIVWSELPTPLVDAPTSTSSPLASTTPDDFELLMSGLVPNTRYYVASYLYDSVTGEYTYGNIRTFVTDNVIYTVAPVNITQTTAISGGKDIDGTITEKGIIWGTSPGLTFDTGKVSTITTANTSNYVLQMTSLIPNTKYYVKAYIVSDGIKYAQEFSFVSRAVEDACDTSTCSLKTVELAPGEVYNFPPLSDLVGIDGAHPEKLKSECDKINDIINEVIEGIG